VTKRKLDAELKGDRAFPDPNALPSSMPHSAETKRAARAAAAGPHPKPRGMAPKGANGQPTVWDKENGGWHEDEQLSRPTTWPTDPEQVALGVTSGSSSSSSGGGGGGSSSREYFSALYSAPPLSFAQLSSAVSALPLSSAPRRLESYAATLPWETPPLAPQVMPPPPHRTPPVTIAIRPLAALSVGNLPFTRPPPSAAFPAPLISVPLPYTAGVPFSCLPPGIAAPHFGPVISPTVALAHAPATCGLSHTHLLAVQPSSIQPSIQLSLQPPLQPPLRSLLLRLPPLHLTSIQSRAVECRWSDPPSIMRQCMMCMLWLMVQQRVRVQQMALDG
jgi:hypothetical protein